MTVSARKAFVLAAGLGTRLGALTQKTPKCLLPVAGRPLLYWRLKTLAAAGVEEALVNTHHLSGQVEAFAAAWTGAPRLTLAREPKLLGTGGTLYANRSFAQGEGVFWIVYADTLASGDLSALVSLHRAPGTALTLGLFRPPDPRLCGVVELGVGGRVLSFEEKPAHPRSPLAAAGIYLAGPELLEELSPRRPDLSRDVFPRLLQSARGLALPGAVIDIGTPESYARLCRDWESLGFPLK